MKNTQIVLSILIMFLLFSCNSSSDKNGGYKTTSSESYAPAPAAKEVSMAPEVSEPEVGEKRNKIIPLPDEYNEEERVADTDDLNAGSDQNNVDANKKKIIKDGSMTIKAKDVSASKKSMNELVKKQNAYYESEALENNDRRTSYDLKIRIPSTNFDAFVLALENGQDEIISKTITAEDVTEEYVDIETRLANKREYLKKYKELLSKAGSVKDIIVIEENIRTLQEEIEAKEGRLKYLNDQVSYSTLSIMLYREKEYVYKAPEQDKFSERMKDSFSSGWTAIVDFVLVLFADWPMVIISCIVLFIVIRFIKRRRARKKAIANSTQ